MIKTEALLKRLKFHSDNKDKAACKPKKKPTKIKKLSRKTITLVIVTSHMQTYLFSAISLIYGITSITFKLT